MTERDTLPDRLTAALGEGYRIEKELGGGGMSRVFLAREVSLDRLVVVKVQAVHGTVDAERFRREILLAAQLQHPHVVPLLTAGAGDGLLFFTMPFVAGESLRALLDRDGALPIPRARALLADIARALGYAHAQGIVHRDIKPDNVLLSSDLAMVTDFGVAKALSSARQSDDVGLTGVGTSLGTPAYIAPEQAAGDPDVDHRADIYAFGAVGYEALTGRPPFTDRSLRAMIAAHIAEIPEPVDRVNPAIPADLAALVMSCLAKEPGERPSSGTELAAALERDEQAAAAPTRWRWALAAAFVAVVAAGAWWWGRQEGSAGALDPHSIGIVPFEELGGAGDYFADGMTEELLVALSRVPGLQVASRASVFALAGQTGLDAQAIGKRLHVGSVLEGSVRRAGDRLRLTAQLTNAQTGLVIWSESFERPASDLFAVQDDLTGAIVRALQVELATGTGATRGTADLAAYDAYLKGRHRWRERSREGLIAAIGLFRVAIERDSGFARAWAGLADARTLLALYDSWGLAGATDSIRAAAQRAMTLDSGLAEAHATLGNLEKSLGRWAEAELELSRALALDSTDGSAHQWLGEVLVYTGRVAEGLPELRRAVAMDSSAPMAHAMVAYAEALAGQDREALAAIERAKGLAPSIWAVYVFEGAAHLAAGRAAEARAAFAAGKRMTDGATAALIEGLELVATARVGDSEAVRERAAVLSRRAEASAFARALGALSTGDRVGSLALLAEAAKERDPFLLASSLNAPWWRDLRNEPGFAAVARALGLDPAQM